jgi:hypothetical protein
MGVSVCEGLRQNYWRQDPTRSICRLLSGKISSLSNGIMEVAAASRTFGPSQPGGHVIAPNFLFQNGRICPRRKAA